jgi:hypothetical protein
LKDSLQGSKKQVKVEIEHLITALIGVEDEETSHINVENIRVLSSGF